MMGTTALIGTVDVVSPPAVRLDSDIVTAVPVIVLDGVTLLVDDRVLVLRIGASHVVIGVLP